MTACREPDEAFRYLRLRLMQKQNRRHMRCVRSFSIPRSVPRSRSALPTRHRRRHVSATMRERLQRVRSACSTFHPRRFEAVGRLSHEGRAAGGQEKAHKSISRCSRAQASRRSVARARAGLPTKGRRSRCVFVRDSLNALPTAFIRRAGLPSAQRLDEVKAGIADDPLAGKTSSTAAPCPRARIFAMFYIRERRLWLLIKTAGHRAVRMSTNRPVPISSERPRASRSAAQLIEAKWNSHIPFAVPAAPETAVAPRLGLRARVAAGTLTALALSRVDGELRARGADRRRDCITGLGCMERRARAPCGDRAAGSLRSRSTRESRAGRSGFRTQILPVEPDRNHGRACLLRWRRSVLGALLAAAALWGDGDRIHWAAVRWGLIAFSRAGTSPISQPGRGSHPDHNLYEVFGSSASSRRDYLYYEGRYGRGRSALRDVSSWPQWDSCVVQVRSRRARNSAVVGASIVVDENPCPRTSSATARFRLLP